MSKRSSESGGEPELKRQRERGDYQHLTKVVRYVLTNNLLRKNIMGMVSEIHNTILSRNDCTTTGKELYNSGRLSHLASYGATTWCAKEYLGMVESSSSLNHSLLKPHLSMVRQSVERCFKSSTQKDLFNKLVDPTYTPSSSETNENEEQYDNKRSNMLLMAMSHPHDQHQLDELAYIQYIDSEYSGYISTDKKCQIIQKLFKDKVGDKLWEEAVINIIKTHIQHRTLFHTITEVAAFCAAPKLVRTAIEPNSNINDYCGSSYGTCRHSRYISLLEYCTPGNNIYNPIREIVIEKCFRELDQNEDKREKSHYHYFEHASVYGILEFFRLTYVRGAEFVITETVLPSLKNALFHGNITIVNFIIDYINSDYAHIKATNEDESTREKRNRNRRSRSDTTQEEYYIDEVDERILTVDLIDRLLECEALSDMFKCTFKNVLESAVKYGFVQEAVHLISISHSHEFQFDYKRIFELCIERQYDTSRIVSLMIEMNLAHPNDLPEEIHQNICQEVAMALACSKPKPPLNADIVKVCIRHGEDVMEALCANRHIHDDIEFVNDRDMITETFGISFKMFSMFRVAAPVLASMEHEDDLDVIPICLQLSMKRGDQECIDYIIENHRDVLDDETIQECMHHLFEEATMDTIKKYVEMFGKFELNDDDIECASTNNNEDVIMYALSWDPSPDNICTAICGAMAINKYNSVIRIIDTYGNQYPDKVSKGLGYEMFLSQVNDSNMIEYILTSPNSPYINGYYTSTFTTRMINQLFYIALDETDYKITQLLDKINSNRVASQLISNSETKSVDIIMNSSMSVDFESTSSRMDQLFHNVFRDSKLAIIVMEQIVSIHESLGFKYLGSLENSDTSFSKDKKPYNVSKGKMVYNSKSLITFIKFGCTQWFIEEYEKLCSFEIYPCNQQLLETAIYYKNNTIIGKLLSNSNIILDNFDGTWTKSMLEYGYHDGLIQEFKMTYHIIHKRLINALSSGSLKLIKYLIDNQMVLSEEESKEYDKRDNDYYQRYRFDGSLTWILKPSMYDMVLLIKQHGLCTGKVHSTLLKFAYLYPVPQSLYELLIQDVKPINHIIEFISDNYQPDKILYLIKYLKENDEQGFDKDGKDNFKKLLMKAVENGPSEVIDWALSKCSTNLQYRDWVQLFKLALKNSNHEMLQMAFTKAGKIRKDDLFTHYSRVSHIEIHPTMFKQEVFTLMGMSECNPNIINFALNNNREDIIQKALNPDHLNQSCACYKESLGCNNSMLLNAIIRGRRDIVEWVHTYHKQRNCSCRCLMMGFEESLKYGHLDMAKLFVDDIGEKYYYNYNKTSGWARNLGRMELSDLRKVSIERLIAATRFKDTSVTEDLIISVLESGIKYKSREYVRSAYKCGLMKLVRYMLKNNKNVRPLDVTNGRPPNFYNHEAIEYFMQSIINIPKKKIDELDKRFYQFFTLFNLTLEKYTSSGLTEEKDIGSSKEKSSRGCPSHQLENLRADQLNDYKICISILHKLNEFKQTMKITKRDIDTLVERHFELIPILIRDDILWTTYLQPCKSIMIKACFHQSASKFNAEGLNFFWNYMHEIKSSSPTLHKQIGILHPFDLVNKGDDLLDNAVKYNQHEFLSIVFNHPHSPLYYKQSFDKNNNIMDSNVNKYLNEYKMKSIKKVAYKYGHIHIINMCNNIINYFNWDCKPINK